jgi:hypothetical protein
MPATTPPILHDKRGRDCRFDVHLISQTEFVDADPAIRSVRSNGGNSGWGLAGMLPFPFADRLLDWPLAGAFPKALARIPGQLHAAGAILTPGLEMVIGDQAMNR